MTRSLKERYHTNQVKLLQERVKVVDDQLMLENRTAKLIIEAMDDGDLKKVAAIVQKLSSIKTPQLPALTAAIEKAEAEINKYTAGGPLTKAWTKMKDLVGIDNPLVKVTTFADALEKGFSQVPLILKNNGIDLKNVDLNKSLSTLLATPKAGDSVGMNKGDRADPNVVFGSGSSQNEADGSVEGKLKLVVDQLRKALAPSGIFGVFKKVPYIDNQALAQELVSAPLRVFSQVAKKVQAGTKAAEIAPDLKSQISGQGDAETKGTASADPAQPSSQTQPTAPTKGTTTTTGSTPTGQTPTPGPDQKRGGGEDVENDDVKNTMNFIDKMFSILSKDSSPEQKKTIAKILVNNGFRPTKSKAQKAA